MTQAELKRAETNATYGPLFQAAWLGLLVVALWATWSKLSPALDALTDRLRTIRDPDGSLVVLLPNAERRNAIQPKLAPAMRTGPGEVAVLAPSTVGGALAREQAIRLAYQGVGQQRGALGPTPAPALPGDGITVSRPELPAQAPWHLFAPTVEGIPLGLGEGGPIVASYDRFPHMLAAGKTGSGKTRRAARPRIAGALGEGITVVSVSDQAEPDMRVFVDHPNYHALTYDDASQAIPLLESANAEIKRRVALLYAANMTTWTRYNNRPDPVVLLVIDEFSALADELTSRERSELFKAAANVARRGRKAGVWLLLGAQDPTADNVRPTIRRQCTPVSFRVQDDAASRVILGESGAETLPDGQFLARLGDIKRGVAWAPGDAEIAAYLDSRTVAPAPAPAWLSLGSVNNNDLAQTIVKTYQETGSMSETQRRVFGDQSTGGANYYTIKQTLTEAGALAR
jgi:hypothetical protein